MDEEANHVGNIWLLKREDARGWLVSQRKAVPYAEIVKIAEGFKIDPDIFKWHAAFHHESHHLHVHFIRYSTNGREGFLNKEGIEKIKSALTNQMLKDELLPSII